MAKSTRKLEVQGYVAYYNLQEWWFSTFSEEERAYMDDHYQPMGRQEHSLIQGNSTSSKPASQFLNELASWFRSPSDKSINMRIHAKVKELGVTNPISRPGYFGGRHYTTYVSDVETLKRNGQLDEAEKLLLNLVAATEAENKIQNLGVAPWYYEQLAIIYRTQKDFDKEVAILERFAGNKHGPGVQPAKLAERLIKSRQLLENKKKSS